MATADKLNYLLETKEEIKNAIVAKGVSVSDADTFRSYANKIAAIQTGSTTVDSKEDALLTGNITEYENDRITSLRAHGLSNYETLESISLPNVTEIGEEGLAYNPNLYSVRLDNVETLGMSCFRDDYSLSEIELSNKITTIPAQCFYDCESLNTLKLPGDTMVTLASVDALTGTMLADGEGSIWVPAALVSQYQSATNWEEYASLFIAGYGPF